MPQATSSQPGLEASTYHESIEAQNYFLKEIWIFLNPFTQEHPALAEDFGCPSGEFFRVKAETTVLKFSAPRTAPARPSNDKGGKNEKKRTSTWTVSKFPSKDSMCVTKWKWPLTLELQCIMFCVR